MRVFPLRGLFQEGLYFLVRGCSHGAHYVAREHINSCRIGWLGLENSVGRDQTPKDLGSMNNRSRPPPVGVYKGGKAPQQNRRTLILVSNQLAHKHPMEMREDYEVLSCLDEEMELASTVVGLSLSLPGNLAAYRVSPP